MKKHIVNPWKWQDQLGYAQGVEVRNNQGTLYCAGQAAMTADGQPSEGNMAQQIELSLQNVEKVVKQAGYHLSNIVRLNIYTTSIDEFFPAYGTLAGWMAQHNILPSSTLVEVSALAYPQLKIEFEATVVD
ncbi:RidA family protein [Mucilaginibacter litoreus]|uniref:RidA family protein n=1 Tax=Mucilaginibacter litoreus TaxID=1048221 RepID=A0ABW3AP00_9SPHI